MYIESLQYIKKNKKAQIIGIIVAVMMMWIAFIFIDWEQLVVSFSVSYAIIEIVLHILLSGAIGFLVTLQIAKPRYKKISNILWWMSGVLGIIITGCPVCGVTLMSTFGLVSILSFLPWFGLEIKILSVILLIWSIDYGLRNFSSCSKKIFNGIFPSLKKTIISIMIFLIIILWIYIVLLEAKWIKVPEYNLKFLFPEHYSIFRYDLQEWCSDTDMFWEFYGQDRKIMIKSLAIYSSKKLKEFLQCQQDEWYVLPDTMSLEQYIQYQKIWENEEKAVFLWREKFIIEKNECTNFICPFVLYSFEGDALLKIILNIKSESINYLDVQLELEKEMKDFYIESY